MTYSWRKALLCIWAVGLAIGGTGCPDEQGKTKKTAASSRKKAEPAPTRKTDPAVADIPLDESAPDDPTRLPKKPAVEPIEVTVQRILVSHRGVKGSTSSRDAAAADRRARRLVAAARKQGANFSELATQFSDEAPEVRTAAHVFHRGPLEADPAELEGALALGIGQVSDPIKTARGLSVLMRTDPQLISSAHILIIFKGSKLAKAAMKRTKAAARKSAERYAKLAQAGKEPFDVLAGRYSDSPSKVRGGIISPVGPGHMLPGFEPYYEALQKLKDRQISDVVETPYGFHVIKRLPFKKIMVRHILIRHNASVKKPEKSRSKHEAKALAAKLRLQIKKGADFGQLAKTYSEDGSAEDGGLLAPVARGQTVPRFEQFAFALKVGQVSAVVETRFGFHVIKRER